MESKVNGLDEIIYGENAHREMPRASPTFQVWDEEEDPAEETERWHLVK